MDRSQAEAIFAAYAVELAAIGDGINGLEALVSDHVRQCAPEARPKALRDAQAIDVLTQRLDAMRALASALSQGEPVHSALGVVPLADLAQRLHSTILARAPLASSAADAGELMLFD
jgi:hypothetical protein